MLKSILIALHKSEINTLRELFIETSVDAPLSTHLQRPLHIAVKNNNKALIKFLVNDLHADVNCTDINGWTPLSHIAVEGGSDKYEIAQLLIALGADVDYSDRNSEYYSPLQLAKDNRDSAPEVYFLFTQFTKNSKWHKRKALLLSFDLCKKSLV